MNSTPVHFADRLVAASLRGGIPMLLLLGSLAAGLIALMYTPREEEPQIVVPMVDVLVSAPGLSPEQVERQVSIPVEKLLTQIPGVEHVYSTSLQGQAAITLRFFVGEDRESSILNTYTKLYSQQDAIPAVVSDWLVRPVEVDDVPILLLALWSSDPERYTDFHLRRLAEEVSTALKRIPQSSEVKVGGGRPRVVQIALDPEGLAARKTTAIEVAQAIQLSNVLQVAGRWTYGDQTIALESGDFLRTLSELENLPVNIIDGQAVFLRDVAMVSDGPAEASDYGWISFGPAHPQNSIHAGSISSASELSVLSAYSASHPMVSISVAKQRGSNAVEVARQVHEKLAQLQAELFPPEIHIEVMRDYGQTANEKVNNLSASLAFAILTVVVFVGMFLGIRPALVVGLAVPICYGVTLALDLAFGYTINRVTLFALILSLGLLVDDPITGVDNIERFLRGRVGSVSDRIIAAIAEIRVPLLMSTLAIILAFIPLAFITGMMGPYMAPMAFNVPISVTVSTVVAFLVTPWLASKILRPSVLAMPEKPNASGAAPALLSFYRRYLTPVLASRARARGVLYVVALLFVAAAVLPIFRWVPLKLLPFDNKNEIQVVIDMAESASLERTAAIASEAAAIARQLPEVSAVAAFVGLPSAVDFNGLVRRYYQRIGPHMADLRITLVDKSERAHQSHAVVLRLRELLAPLQSADISLKVVEVPPGPPVLSTLVAEIYADDGVSYHDQQAAAQRVVDRLRREPLVVEVDSSIEADRQRLRFVTDKQKAALSGIATEDINTVLTTANQGRVVGHLNLPREARPLPIELRLPVSERASKADFLRLQVKARAGIVSETTDRGLDSAAQPLVALGELGAFETSPAEQTIYRKDLRPVVYVSAELSGRTPAEVIADVQSDFGRASAENGLIRTLQERSFLSPGGGDGWTLPDGIHLNWSGEGEWRITLRVFRDMGLAFAFALLAIFFVLRIQTASTPLSLIIMSAIPLTVIGIMPGFWLLNVMGSGEIAGAPDPVLFTATAMIGMIALAGIVVRNSLILVEFISQQRAAGEGLREALIQAGAVRMRPVLLTAGTTLLGNLVITLDPVFNGLALAIIFGILASTLFTLLVVPVAYLLVFDRPTSEEG